MTPALIWWLTGGAAAVAIAAGVWKAISAVSRAWRRVLDFLDDWRGEEARPGFPARPGVPQRLETVERAVTANTGRLEAMEARIERIDGELQPNNGTSFRDEVRRGFTPEER